MNSDIDYLDEDPIIYRYKFVCLSFISPNCLVKHDNDIVKIGKMAIKIRGAYSTYDDAIKRVKYLEKNDNVFNIFIGEVGKWMPVNIGLSYNDKKFKSLYQNQEVQQDMIDKLNYMMKLYKEHLENKKEEEINRKNEMLKDVNVCGKRNLDSPDLLFDNTIDTYKNSQSSDIQPSESQLNDDQSNDNQQTVNINSDTLNNIDETNNDDLPLPKQKYTCISFLSNNDIPNNDCKNIAGIKIRGIFSSYEKAQEKVKEIIGEKDNPGFDINFNVYIGEVGKWLPFVLNEEEEITEDEKYSCSKEDELMRTIKHGKFDYYESESKSKKDIIKEKLQKKLKDRNTQINDPQNGEQISKEELEKEDKELKNKLKESAKLETEIKNEKYNVNILENNLKKIKELYNELKSN